MAVMKTSVGRLYMLFDACLPKNEKIKKRLNICRITESSEYNELKAYSPFVKQFEEHFSAEKLANYDVDKLDEIVKVIPKIIPMIEQLNNAITYGNALELTEKDIPDFTSVKSIDNIAKKLKIDKSTPNVTNISSNNFMDIFSDKTIKEPTEALKSISPADIENPIEAVRRNLTSSTYCIKVADIEAIQNEFAEKVSEAKAKLDGIKKDKWKLRYKKWLCIGVAIIILTVINSFEIVSQSNSIGLISLSTLLLILYFFIG